jgi:FlaA1/EpsC-like NDP-sugar epimerase
MNSKKIDTVIETITGRSTSFFTNDLKGKHAGLITQTKHKSALVIGGAGTIGSNFIKALLHYPIARLYVIDLNENGLAELIRDIRSNPDYEQLPTIKTYPISFGSRLFEKLFLNEGPFEIVANFAAHKHVRSAKDSYAIEAMFDNNFVEASRLLEILKIQPPEHFFCVSTDKATNPVSIMGATKKLMEDVIFAYQDHYKVATARFANVAFSNGSLLESFINRYYKNQPIVCPTDINRFFVSPKEAGQICLLACLLGQSGDIFIPRFSPDIDLVPFKKTLDAFLETMGIEPMLCKSEEEARQKCTQPVAGQHPVFLFETDTSGEKPYEEFYGENDVVDWETFEALGAIKTNETRKKVDVHYLLNDASQLFHKKTTTKASIITFLERHIPEFNYIDKGKSLDQKM